MSKIENEILYMAFEIENSMFAVHADWIYCIMQMTEDLPHAILPDAPEDVRCIIKLAGLFITVIDLTGTVDDIWAEGRMLVVLEHDEMHIGIIADDAYPVTISRKEILQDRIAGTRAFVHSKKTYSILEGEQLYRYFGM